MLFVWLGGFLVFLKCDSSLIWYPDVSIINYCVKMLIGSVIYSRKHFSTLNHKTMAWEIRATRKLGKSAQFGEA